MARLIAFAATDERIGAIMRKATHTVQAGKRTINVASTNHLVRSGEIDVLGGKTGFITSSGYCIASLLRLPQTGQQVAVVVLGAKSNQGRFWETRHLFNWMTSHAQKLLGIAQPPVPPTEGPGALRIVTSYKLQVQNSGASRRRFCVQNSVPRMPHPRTQHQLVTRNL